MIFSTDKTIDSLQALIEEIKNYIGLQKEYVIIYETIHFNLAGDSSFFIIKFDYFDYFDSTLILKHHS